MSGVSPDDTTLNKIFDPKSTPSTPAWSGLISGGHYRWALQGSKPRVPQHNIINTDWQTRCTSLPTGYGGR
ncbi:MAG: hypothetical protein R3B95_00450 [Nitrospirales bacterium]|nr:hypothetical protein [Nitrospirales bacterium]